MDEIDSLKDRIIEVVGVLVHQGLIKSSGHVSARVPGRDLFLITGHIHEEDRAMDDLTPEDIVLVDLKGERVEGKLGPPGEVFIHSCIYRARPEVGGVAHCHPLHSVALSVAGVHPVPVFTTGVIFAPRVPIYDDPRHIDMEERGEALAQALDGKSAVVMRGHGTVTVGGSPEEAGVVALLLEENARMQIIASSLGPNNKLKTVMPQDMDEAFVKGVDRRGPPHSLWVYYRRAADRMRERS